MAAPNCSNNSRHGRYKFYRFPSDIDRRKRLLVNSRRQDWKPTSSKYVTAAQPCPSCRHVTFQLPHESPPPPRCLSASALEHAQTALRLQRQQLSTLEAVRALSPPRPSQLPPSPPTPPPEAEAAGERLEAARRHLEAVRGALEAAPVLSCRSVATNTASTSSSAPGASARGQQAKPPPTNRKPQKLQKNETSNLKKTSSSQTDALARPRASGGVPSSSTSSSSSSPRSRVAQAVLRTGEQVSASRASVGALRALLMPRQPKKPRQPKHQPQHQPHCKYYQGEPRATNAAILDVRSREEGEAAEAEARRCRLQLQRLPALTIRRQLQVQWGPTVSLPQPGESPPQGPPPGHNVRVFEVRHGDAQATPAAASTSVAQKQAEARSHQQPLTGPLRRVDVSPLRELPPERPPAQAPPPPPVLPSPPTGPPSSPRRSSQVRQQTSAARVPSRARPSRHAATRPARGQTLAVTIPSMRSRGAASSRVAPSASPSPTPSGRSRAAAGSSPRHSSAHPAPVARRASPLPGRDAATTASRPARRAPARLDITATSLPPSVQGGLVPGDQPDALLRELSLAAEERRIAGTPAAAASDCADRPLGGEHEARPFAEMPAADAEEPGPSMGGGGDGGGNGDGDLWSAAQRIRRQQEVAEIEHRVLDLIGARVVAGLLNMDSKVEIDNWRDYGIQQPSLSDEVGEHRVLGEGISLEEREIRTPINYDDYLNQEPADTEAEYNGDSGSPDYEDDFEEEEEEADHQESPAAIGDTREKEPQHHKVASVPEIQVDTESLKDDKLGQEVPEVGATPPGPEPAAPSTPPALSSSSRSPPSPRRFGAVRIRSRRTGAVTTVSLPLPTPAPAHIPTPTPTPVSSPECRRHGTPRRVVTPERSPSPRSSEGDRVPTPPPSPQHARERPTLYKWRSRIEAPPAPALTPPASPPPAPLGAFSFTPEGASLRSSPPLLTDRAVTDDTPAEPPRTGTRQQTSGELQAATEAPVPPAGYSRALGASLTSSSSLANSSSLSSNPQVQSQDTLSWGEVRSCRDASSSADTQLSHGEVRSGAAREPACLCSSLSEGEVASRHRCSKAPSSHGQAMAEPGRSLATSAVGAAALRREDRGTQKDLSEGEVSEGLFPAGHPYDDTDSTSASDAS